MGPTGMNIPPLQDAVLDQLVGRWIATGTVGPNGEHTITERVHGDWVLHHQFLHLSTHESTGRYEAELYIGYDSSSDRYIGHLLDIFGGRSSETLGYGLRTPDRIQIVFDRPSTSVRHTWNWNAKDSSWQYQIEVRDHSGKWHTVSSLTLKKPGR